MKQILFTGERTAELVEKEIPAVDEYGVLCRTEYSVVSGGTERANLIGLPNIPGGGFPRALGYCSIGRVLKTGGRVTTVKPGDRVLIYHGTHSAYNVREEDEITKVFQDDLKSEEAAFTIIASMGLGGVRKLHLELGESAMVMGLGLLGIFAIRFLHLSGANPLIAADLNPERRALALELGADYAFDPADPDFTKNVREVTGGKGVNAIVEVTGVSKAMLQALECASFMGRISLLGCTRISDSAVDYYQQVHRPGVQLIGAHNFVRPKHDSYPGHWTHQDDCQAILSLMAAGKLPVDKILSRIVQPEECEAVYHELSDDPHFPLGTVFDWTDARFNEEF